MPDSNLCKKVDAHVHADTLQYGNIEDRTVFWLLRHPLLVEFEAAALQRRWDAAQEMLETLKAIKELDPPCPFNPSDGRYQEWFAMWAKLQEVIRKAQRE